MGVSRSTTQSPKGYDLQNLTATKLGLRFEAAASATLRGNLRTTIQDVGDRYKIHAAETAALLVDADLAFGYDRGDIRRHKADLTGVANARTPLQQASDSNSTGSIYLATGTYKVSSNLTIAASIEFAPGAILKPDAGVTITLSRPFYANAEQIFDISGVASSIKLPRGTNRVYAEWFGAKGDLVKTNNEVPINQAIAALAVVVDGTSGGSVLVERGDFYLSGPINLKDEISLVGSGKQYPAFFSYNAGWAGSYMVDGTDGTNPLFNSRVENLRFNAQDNGNIVACIHSSGWQEKCGLINVLLEAWKTYGFAYDTGYGGAALLTLRNVESWASTNAFAGARCISVAGLVGFSVGFLNVITDQITVAGATSKQAAVSGFYLDGNIILNANGLHSEQMANMFLLLNGARVCGQGVAPSGSNDVATLFNCSASWTGKIDCAMVQKAGADTIVADSNRAYAIANVQPYDDHVYWPPDPLRAVAGASVQGGAAPAIRYGRGLTVAHPATGQYRFTLTTTMDGQNLYDVVATLNGTAAHIAYAERLTATSFDVFTLTHAGVATDVAELSVKVFHAP